MALNNKSRERMDSIMASVLADGMIHVSVPEGTEGAVERRYATEDDKKSGNDKKGILSGVKHELVYTELVGMLQKVDFFEGNYGINLLLTIGDEEDEKPVTLSLSVDSNFGEDMMKKLPNIDLKRPVTLIPYSFENDKGKKQRGITVQQENKKGEKEKIQSFYYDAEKKVNINGYPKMPATPKGKPLTKSQWRKFFDEAREFLIEDITERFNINKENSKTAADKEFDEM